MIIALILFCEVMFWVLLLSGLAARYLMRLRGTSTVLLLLVPVLDLVLIGAVAVHLHGGGTAETGHALGVLYFGFTVSYGHSVIRWVDGRFAYRFAGAPKPPPGPKHGWPRVRSEALGWARGVLACALSGATLIALILWVGDPQRTEALRGAFTPLGIFLFWNTVIAGWGVVEGLVEGSRARGAATPAR